MQIIDFPIEILANITFSYYKKSTYSRFCYCSKKAIIVLKWLYKNSNTKIYLDRKYEKFLEILEAQTKKEERKALKEEKRIAFLMSVN